MRTRNIQMRNIDQAKQNVDMLKQTLRSSRHLTSHTSNQHIEANQTHECIPQRVALDCAARRHSCAAPNRRSNAYCALSAVADRTHSSIWRRTLGMSVTPPPAPAQFASSAVANAASLGRRRAIAAHQAHTAGASVACMCAHSGSVGEDDDDGDEDEVAVKSSLLVLERLRPSGARATVENRASAV